ncbi:MAG: PleD family two-component system response regulator [Syntrophorhabdaceae bacterium]|nr:PleD family two-component system response regulator [Syntrophorhabdaceae bacterium]
MEEQHERQKILIVDDKPSNIMVLGEELKRDYDIYIATNGEMAIKKAISNPPDLILLDIVMPGMDGYDVCKQLKENEITKNIPIIFITAKNTDEDEAKGLSIGAVDYITKPFSIPIVKARVKTHLELKRKTDILESLSFRDGLTGIFNRRQLENVLSNEWKRAARKGEPISLLFIDIDYFKAYNDYYGHVAGDECLKMVAKALTTSLRRSTDFVARYGGEEFAVILPETDIDNSLIIAEKFRNTIIELKIEHKFSKVEPYLTISIGVATTYPTRDSEYKLLIEVADNVLYEAKNSGRNRICYRTF